MDNGRLFLFANGTLAFFEELVGEVLSGVVGVIVGVCEGLGSVFVPMPWDE